MKVLFAWILFLSFLADMLPKQDVKPILYEADESAAAEIRIDLSENLIYLDETVRVIVNVEYDDTVDGHISLTNDLGDTLMTVFNDGSGKAQVAMELHETEARRAYLTGVCGEVQSEPEYYRVQPRITEEMGQRLDSVLDGMIEQLNAAQITDPDSPEVHAMVCEYLAANPYVESYGENNGNILFRTTDGLMGFYGFHASDEMVFSSEGQSIFLPAEQTFSRYEANTLQGDEIVKSGIPVTNERILFISPQDGDRTIDWGRSAFDPRLRVLANETAFDYENVTGAAAIERLKDGDITDCGLLVFMAHGGQLLTDHGFMLTMSLGALTVEQRLSMLDLTWAKKSAIGMTDRLEQTTDSEEIEHVYYINDETAHVLYGVSSTDGNFTDSAAVTRSFMEYVLEDKTFDNTIAYFVVCYAASDPGMRELLFENGASAFIGTMDPLMVSTSFVALEQICDMARELEGGNYTTLEEAVDRVGEMPGEEMMRELHQSMVAVNGTTQTQEEYIADLREEYPEEQLNNALLLYLRDAECGVRVWLGEGNLQGRVIDKDGAGIADAQVRFYRWLNHTFEQTPNDEFTLKTDADGRYTAENLPYGQYIVKAEKNGSENYVHAELKGKECEARDIVLEETQIIVTTTVEKYESKTLSSLVVTPTVYITNAPEAAERINARLTEICSAAQEHALERRDDSITSENQRNAYDLNVSDIFSSGSLLFITFSEYEYMSGAAHGMSWATALVFDATTGEEVSMDQLLSGTSEAADRLTDLIADALTAKYANEVWSSTSDLARDVIHGERGSWDLTEEGLRVYFSPDTVAAHYVGYVEVIIPYADLRGVLPDKYMPAPAEGSGSANILFSETMGDFGSEGACILKAEGIVQQVKVMELTDGYERGQRFYASLMQNQSACLPEVGDGAYFVEYNSGGQKIELTVE